MHIHTYTHTYIHTNIQTYIHTYNAYIYIHAPTQTAVVAQILGIHHSKRVISRVPVTRLVWPEVMTSL